jgi:pimeloyl-ACP methyl ester carboxylesterase
MISRKIRHATPPGQMVDLGGFRLHAVVCGEGKSTVVFEPALGGFSLQYARVQSAVSAFTRAIAYDRAGQGWSDASPTPRIPVNLAGELKVLLSKLELQPPYVLVGHSFGGLLTRIYAGLNPGEVAGMVLVDAAHVEEYSPFPDIDRFIRQTAMGVRLLKIVSRLGLGKQITKLSLGSAAKAFSREDLEAFITIASQPKHHETMLAEFSQHRHYYGPQSEVPPTLGDIPLIVITAGQSVSGKGKIGGSITGDEMNVLHQKLQKDLVQLSSQSEQIVIPDATHMSILTQPKFADQVTDAVRRMVERVP